MKKITMILSVLFLGTFLVAGSASALTFTFNNDAFLSLYQVWENPVSATALFGVTQETSAYGQPMKGQVGYYGLIDDVDTNPFSPFASIGIGADFWGTGGDTTAQVIGTALGTAPTNSLEGYTEYSVTFFNDNDDIWWVNLFMNTGFTDAPFNETDNFYENGWTAIGPDGYAQLTLSLVGLENLDHVTNIGFMVAGNLTNVDNNPSDPDVFHMSVQPIPEPTTILLFGVGLITIAGLGRKRFFK